MSIFRNVSNDRPANRQPVIFVVKSVVAVSASALLAGAASVEVALVKMCSVGRTEATTTIATNMSLCAAHAPNVV